MATAPKPTGTVVKNLSKDAEDRLFAAIGQLRKDAKIIDVVKRLNALDNVFDMLEASYIDIKSIREICEK